MFEGIVKKWSKIIKFIDNKDESKLVVVWFWLLQQLKSNNS